MKKLLTMIALAGLMVAFSGCSKNKPNEHSAYTEKQQKVFALFNGTWADYQFSIMSMKERMACLDSQEI